MLGKHHKPKVGWGGDLSLYRPDTVAWRTSNAIQDHIQHYISNNELSIILFGG
jgi:hypothetical protein